MRKYRPPPNTSVPSPINSGQPTPSTTPGQLAHNIMPVVSGIHGTLPVAAGAIGHGIHGMPLHGLVHPQTVTMGLPIAGATAVGAMAASAAQGLIMHPGGIPTAVGIVRAPPMMAGIAGTPAPPLPPGTPFGHPIMRPPMGGHPGKANNTLSFCRVIQIYFASLPSHLPNYFIKQFPNVYSCPRFFEKPFQFEGLERNSVTLNTQGSDVN